MTKTSSSVVYFGGWWKGQFRSARRTREEDPKEVLEQAKAIWNAQVLAASNITALLKQSRIGIHHATVNHNVLKRENQIISVFLWNKCNYFFLSSKEDVHESHVLQGAI